ncbi:hypothetical protein BJY01DRAFT_101149 [Aspergillus pseudoustus]|uniref:Uncharacterized protein n=1 Tax=Aspergillus pseudoustus TaxID=1810923 RepID=A0ABR4IYG5_9EURO
MFAAWAISHFVSTVGDLTQLAVADFKAAILKDNVLGSRNPLLVLTRLAPGAEYTTMYITRLCSTSQRSSYGEILALFT